MLAAVFEKTSNSLLPRKYLAMAIKSLSSWYKFIKLSLFKHHVYVTVDREAVDVLSTLLKQYGYRFLGVDEVKPGHPLYKILSDLVNENAEVRCIKRLLLSYTVSSAVLQNGEVVVDREAIEKFMQVNSVAQSTVESVAKSLNNLVLLAINARCLKQDAVLAFGHLVLRREPHYVIPLRKAAVAGSRRWRIGAEGIHKAAELIRKNCGSAASIKELESCSKNIARRYHAAWRQLLRAVKRHPIYIGLYAKTLMNELGKLGSEIQSWELWRVRLIV